MLFLKLYKRLRLKDYKNVCAENEHIFQISHQK